MAKIENNTSATTTIAKKFLADPRVLKAKQELLNVLKEYQTEIQAPIPAKDALKSSYAEIIQDFQNIRGGNLFYPYLASGIGHGALVELADGSLKYDFISGIGVHHYGHSHPKLIDASLTAALSDTVMQGNLQQSDEALLFSKTLLDAANAKGGKFAHCFVSATGVMAGENALKITFQKKHPATRILAFEGCFMGRTLAFSQFTDKAAYREGLPLNYDIDYVPFYDAKRPKESTAEALAVLKKHLHRYPKQHAAMCFELILGEGGFYPAERDFHVTLMDELRRHDIAILVDEVQSFARTTELFAFQYYDLGDYVDALWVGKASQACATLFRADFKPRAGLLSQTYTASSTALAAGRTLIEDMLSEDYFGVNGKIAKFHAHGKRGLEDLAKKHPDKIAGPYGIGAMVGFTPLGGLAEKVTKFIHKLYENGVIAFTAGASPMRARFLLPVGAITTDDIDAVMKIVEKTLIEVA